MGGIPSEGKLRVPAMLPTCPWVAAGEFAADGALGWLHAVVRRAARTPT
jgi:hypothetical protein